MKLGGIRSSQIESVTQHEQVSQKLTRGTWMWGEKKNVRIVSLFKNIAVSPLSRCNSTCLLMDFGVHVFIIRVFKVN